MERIFIQLVNMSFVAGWLILAVLLIRGIFKNLPKEYLEKVDINNLV